MPRSQSDPNRAVAGLLSSRDGRHQNKKSDDLGTAGQLNA